MYRVAELMCMPIHHDAEAARRSAAGRRELKPLLGVLDGLAELLEELVVVVAGQQVTCGDDHGDRPVDELECSQRGQTAVVGKLLRVAESRPAR